jgi:hypothetical protein
MNMGKMPEGLRKYWAKHGRGRKARKIREKVTHTARRYFGRRRRGGSGRTISILGIAAGSALALGILARGKGGEYQYAGSPVGYLKEGRWDLAVNAAGKNLTDPGSYMPVILPLAIMLGMRMLHVKGRVTKRISIA